MGASLGARNVLAERRADVLRSRLEQTVQSSAVLARESRRGIEEDMDAVKNLLTLPWNSGPV